MQTRFLRYDIIGLGEKAYAQYTFGERSDPAKAEGMPEQQMKEIDIHAIGDFHIGNAEDTEAGTGCTVILSKSGAVPGVDVRGGAPGTRETDLIDSREMIERIHAVVLAGGSAYGLDASTGVMRYLEEQGIGFDTGAAKVPIVASAVLFDLAFKSSSIRPDRTMGYEAAGKAMQGNYRDGSVGAGTGATVGKILGPKSAMKSGIGSYAVEVGGVKVGAIIAVNAFGSVYEGQELIAGPRLEKSVMSTEDLMIRGMEARFHGNTTIGCILTNAKLTKAQANKLASMGHDGFARSIRPVHTMVDGDTLFVMADGEAEIDLSTLGTIASIVVEKAVVNAIRNAVSLDHLPTSGEFLGAEKTGR
jgi:L-aminopeptidase/D-esterase-like protein